MGKLVTGKVTGLREFKSSLNSYNKAIKKAIDKALQDGANDIASDARVKCKTQSIASEIRAQKVEDKWTIVTDSKMSAYLEFGTGNYAKALLSHYPEDWRRLAQNFYVNGLGRIPSQPYLYPAFQQNKGEVLNKVKENVELI